MRFEPQNTLDFKDQSVLVCGGSDGIGYGIARAFLSAGARVSVTGTRRQGDYDQTFSGIEFHTLDVREPGSVTTLAAQFNTLDVLVNSVGSVLYKSAEFERKGFAQIVDINLTGVMHLCTSFFAMLAASGGNIVNIDSIVAIRPALNNPAYTASKAGLAQLTRGLAMKWAAGGCGSTPLLPVWCLPSSPPIKPALMPLRHLQASARWAGLVRCTILPVRCCFWRRHRQPMSPGSNWR